jgi:methylated-DNA-[protein]-cysteine S-methyltransferase
MPASFSVGECAFATSWGPVLLAWSGHGLTKVRLPDPDQPHRAANPAPASVYAAARLLADYFAGAPVDFTTLTLDTRSLSPTDAAIYAALRLVPTGETLTYGELAARAGHPGAARAVGVAMARNPWPVVVPCHRVMAADGALHGFSAPGGTATKRRLLRLEGVELDGGKLAGTSPLLPGLLPDG